VHGVFIHLAGHTTKHTCRTLRSNVASPPPLSLSLSLSQAGNTLYVSGQLGLTPDKNFAGDTIESQTEQVLCNIGEILKAAGANFSHVVKTTILLADMADFQAVNELYGERFSANPAPARATYAVNALPLGGLLEIECIAYVPN
jgi:2-iminobutanoate/2-iminopropanoate deaminase